MRDRAFTARARLGFLPEFSFSDRGSLQPRGEVISRISVAVLLLIFASAGSGTGMILRNIHLLKVIGYCSLCRRGEEQ